MSNERGCQCGQAHGACTSEFQYAVKVVCGEVVSQDNVPTPVAPGRYWTAINIHNPAKCQTAHLRWKVTVANPIEPGPVSAYQRPIVLQPDRAVEIDCPQLMKALPQQPPLRFVKGYVVIESDIELDVVAVYSGTPGPCGSNTFHTERVEARCVPVCEDLVLPLNTGFADWRTVAPTPGQLGPAVPVITNWGVAAPFPSKWIGQFSTDGQSNTSAGLRYYELCFDLCFGFEIPNPGTFPIQVLVDDSATVQLVNSAGTTSLGPTVPAYTLTTINVSGLLLRPGRNCLRVTVNNVVGATGFALAGTLHAIRGKCPCSPLPIAAQSQGPTGLDAQSVEGSVAG